MDSKLIDEMARRAAEVIAATPIGDLQKNLRALFESRLARMNLVTRAEFESQQEVLRRTREKLAQMEARVRELEARIEEHE
ncbi:MAG TPA: accessory factor UbiK family protein [Burkholderiales bacterium]|nr:accessory factor UbiK family protein [Burkholderiales bacterium]